MLLPPARYASALWSMVAFLSTRSSAQAFKACRQSSDNCCMMKDGDWCGNIARPAGDVPFKYPGDDQGPTFQVEFSIHAFLEMDKVAFNKPRPMMVVGPVGNITDPLHANMMRDGDFNICTTPDYFRCVSVAGLDGPLEVHGGNFCDESKWDDHSRFDNLWIRYQGDFLNVPEDCEDVDETIEDIITKHDKARCTLHIRKEPNDDWPHRELVKEHAFDSWSCGEPGDIGGPAGHS